MEMGAAGIPRGRNLFFSGTPHGLFRNLADDKNSGASVRILGIDCHVKLVM